MISRDNSGPGSSERVPARWGSRQIHKNLMDGNIEAYIALVVIGLLVTNTYKRAQQLGDRKRSLSGTKREGEDAKSESSMGDGSTFKSSASGRTEDMAVVTK